MTKVEKVEKLEINSSGTLRDWLLINDMQPDDSWMVTSKKSSPMKCPILVMCLTNASVLGGRMVSGASLQDQGGQIRGRTPNQ